MLTRWLAKTLLDSRETIRSEAHAFLEGLAEPVRKIPVAAQGDLFG